MTQRDAKKAAKLYGTGATLDEVADSCDVTWDEAKEAVIAAGGVIRRGRPKKRA